MSGAITPALASDFSERAPSREAWVGVDAFRGVWSIYSGNTIAPFGQIQRDGFRIRTVSGVSGYRYTGRRFDPDTNTSRIVAFKGMGGFVDLLAGYQGSAGPLHYKVFGGVAIQAHNITPFDTETIVQGNALGVKGALELWLNIGQRGFASLDFGRSDPYRTWSIRSRAGFKWNDDVSFGAEARAYGHIEGERRRIGLFLRSDAAWSEISVSSGASLANGLRAEPYVAAQYLTRF